MNISSHFLSEKDFVPETRRQCLKNFYKTCLVAVIVDISYLSLLLANNQRNKQYSLNYIPYFQRIFTSTFSIKDCETKTTLRHYCSTILQCKEKNLTYISTDISMLDDITTSSTSHSNFSLEKHPYLLSKQFVKFKTFHQSTKFPLSIHSLDDYVSVIRVPALDTPEYPNNNPMYLYIYPRTTIHRSQYDKQHSRSFNYRTYTTGKAKQYKAAFFIVTDAVAHSLDGNILVQTCSRAITVTGCSLSNTTARLQSEFPSTTKNRTCSKNSTGAHIKVISVDKLVIIAHTWYNAYYHLTMEAMSRVMILHELLIFDPKIYILLQYPLYRKAATELFKLYGLAENRIVYFSPGMEASTLFRAQTMFIPRGIDCGGAPPSLLEQISIKGLIPSNTGTVPPKPYLSIPLPIIHVANRTARNVSLTFSRVKTGPIVLLSRSKRARSIQNQVEILNFFAKEYSAIPVIVFYGNMSLTDTIALFHSARILVTPHGAGQSHILWMRPGTAMLEISSQREYNRLYESIAICRQINTAIVFDVLTSSRSTLKVNMAIFKQIFNELMQGRY